MMNHDDGNTFLNKNKRKIRRIALVLLIIAAVVCFLAASAAYVHTASSRLDTLNGKAHTVYNAIYTWQADCAELGTDAVLPPVTELQRGTDTAADSLTKQISAYYADIEKVLYYRVQSDADGKVTGVLVSQSPIKNTWRPNAKDQRTLLANFLTAKRAVGYYSIYPDITYE